MYIRNGIFTCLLVLQKLTVHAVLLAGKREHQGTRAEVRGGGKKPFAQKGTGNARQGSSTTPLKPGGGVVFGPRVSLIHTNSDACKSEMKL